MGVCNKSPEIVTPACKSKCVDQGLPLIFQCQDDGRLKCWCETGRFSDFK